MIAVTCIVDGFCSQHTLHKDETDIIDIIYYNHNYYETFCNGYTNESPISFNFTHLTVDLCM